MTGPAVIPPDVDVRETPDCYVFVADVPGLKPHDCSVRIENDCVLILSGERTRDEVPERPESRYLQKERRVGKFVRKFTLPSGVENTLIAAACQDGVLTVLVPKCPIPHAQRPKFFEIRIGSSFVQEQECEPEEKHTNKKENDPAPPPPPEPGTSQAPPQLQPNHPEAAPPSLPF